MDKSTCKTVGCEQSSDRLGMCRPCYNKAYYLANRERVNARAIAWQKANPVAVAAIRERYKPREARTKAAYKAANPDKIKAAYIASADKRQAYLAANREHTRARTKAYTKTNTERAKERKAARDPARDRAVLKAWRLANIDKLREQDSAQHKAARLANPERASNRGRESYGRRKALKFGSVVTKADFAAILAEFGMVCHICGLDILTRKDLDFDHVIPLAKGGAHSPENIRPSHSHCNRSKGDRI